MVKVHLCTFLSLCMPGKICGEHTGEACDEEVRKKTPEFLGGEEGSQAEYSGERLVFVFHHKRGRAGGAGCKMVARWLKLPFG